MGCVLIRGILLCLIVFAATPAWAPNRRAFDHFVNEDCDTISAKELTLNPVAGTGNTYQFCLATGTSGTMHAYTNNEQVNLTPVGGGNASCYQISYPVGIGAGVLLKFEGIGCFIGIVKEAKTTSAPTIMDGDTHEVPADNCPLVANPDQADTNGNGEGDACEDRLEKEKEDPGATQKADSYGCIAGELFDDEDQQCYPDIDSDGDGLIDAKDRCNGVVDPTNTCGVLLNKSTGTDGASTDDGSGCSLLARARTRHGTGTMLCGLVTLLAIALARQFRH